jgi:acetoin utilization protein AcuB
MDRFMPSVADYMTPGPFSIAPHETLSRARGLMREYGVRHLPVIDGNKLVGVVSERDINFTLGFGRVRLDAVSVEIAMTRRPYAVRPDASLNQVARIMAERKYGSVVVMEKDVVIGVLTTTDALHALADTLEGKHTRRAFEGIAGRPLGLGRRSRLSARERRER